MADAKSLMGCLLTYMGFVLTEAIKSNIMFFIAVAVGISTFLYNTIRWYKELKK